MTISAEDREKLVSLARGTVEAEVTGKPLPKCEDPSGLPSEQRGCFVTLTNSGRLRGCIGTFQPDAPLGEMIVEMARSATHDSRFVYNPITPAELADIHVEVSILSPLEETSNPEKLQVGIHGIYIIRGGASGCFLPEVATDMNWTAEEFLDCCCESKAHLPRDAWRQEGTKVYLFSSDKFGG